MSFNKDDIVTNNDLDQMQANLQWLKDNTPRSRFFRENTDTTSDDMVLVSGRVSIDKSKESQTAIKSIRFGRAFASNCRPNVSLGIVCQPGMNVHVVVNGPDNQLLPNSSGFQIKAYVPGTSKKTWKINKDFHVCWQAVGYRTRDMDDF